MSETSPAEFPALLEVEYPDRELDWLTTFLRPFMVIPIAIVLGLLSGPAAHAGAKDLSLAAGGIVWLPTVLMLTFRRKYPRVVVRLESRADALQHPGCVLLGPAD